jgi:hypothetical protein
MKIKKEHKMSTLTARLIATGFGLLFTLISGVWLSSSGKPLNTLIFTIHKLIALGTVVYTGLTIYQLYKSTAISALQTGGIVVTGLLFLALFISGALLSLGKPVGEVVLAIHRVIPLLAAMTTAGTIYLLVSASL